MAKMSRSDAGKLGAIKARPIIAALKNSRVKEYDISPALCKGCCNKLSYEDNVKKKVFCTHSCSATYYNNTTRTKDMSLCVWCNNTCKTRGSTYCSSSCQQSKKRSDKINSGSASFAIIKTHLKKTTTNCQICGISEWLSKPILLIADHIDGDSGNNNINNIRLICSNCDATLPTYKSRNKNSGRSYRRERYASGKSY